MKGLYEYKYVFYLITSVATVSGWACDSVWGLWCLAVTYGLNYHCLRGNVSDLKWLSSTDIITMFSSMNYARSLEIHNRFSLKEGSLYLRLACIKVPYLRWNTYLRVLVKVFSHGTLALLITVSRWLRS